MDIGGGYPYIVMEKIRGYTLAQISERGGLIIDPSWTELEKLVLDLNNQKQIVHRDLHIGNIMLQTEQDIIKARRELSGKLYIIDFGSSKRIFSDRPSPDDYTLTIGSSVIKYTTEHSNLRPLKPRPGGDNLFLE